jgi:hypothetical protein
MRGWILFVSAGDSFAGCVDLAVDTHQDRGASMGLVVVNIVPVKVLRDGNPVGQKNAGVVSMRTTVRNSGLDYLSALNVKLRSLWLACIAFRSFWNPQLTGGDLH